MTAEAHSSFLMARDTALPRHRRYLPDNRTALSFLEGTFLPGTVFLAVFYFQEYNILSCAAIYFPSEVFLGPVFFFVHFSPSGLFPVTFALLFTLFRLASKRLFPIF
jgi:hypothetical protein